MSFNIKKRSFLLASVLVMDDHGLTKGTTGPQSVGVGAQKKGSDSSDSGTRG